MVKERVKYLTEEVYKMKAIIREVNGMKTRVGDSNRDDDLSNTILERASGYSLAAYENAAEIFHGMERLIMNLGMMEESIEGDLVIELQKHNNAVKYACCRDDGFVEIVFDKVMDSDETNVWLEELFNGEIDWRDDITVWVRRY